ncbi:glycosyltransferase family 2 protein [Leptolyngbya sp. NIES-2104]|uniref:glycosyltransferase family 2 protein n=1 Tax=Leptolyngbya sp. NIES-2104 TaxID=1552121 RepID=UPI0006ECA3D1|nr:glycosyltransferase [Leptolyngbya sp. NIES-2104]GAP96218.1 glycosyl transferase, family 2 [Leptolyngbya sp. NIES-2104]
MNSFKPWKVLHLDLSDPIPDLNANDHYQGLYLVIFWANIPLGHLELQMAQLPMVASELRNLILQAIAPSVGSHLLKTGFQGELPIDSPKTIPPDLTEVLALEKPLELMRSQTVTLPTESSVSVIVCTRDRPHALKDCLRSLQALDPPPFEVLVIDNAPSSDATYQIVAQMPNIRYVKEPRSGLSAARNRGIQESRGSILAFTDDDVAVHPHWTARLQQAFSEPRILAVTGLVLPTQLETESQFLFEKSFGGFGQGYRSKEFDSAFFQTMQGRGVPVWRMGAGANMAFRRSIFEKVGEFDQRLGAGRSGCSEDSELWYRILAEGGHCYYEPKAVVFHTHRTDLASLKSQMYQYMRGHVTALLIQFEHYRHWGNLRRLGIALPRYYLRRTIAQLLNRSRIPAEILSAEIRGCLAGLLFYWQNRQSRSNTNHE